MKSTGSEPGLTRFLTMAKVAEVEDGVVITSLTVWQFSKKKAKEANIIATRISSRCWVSRIEKRLVKLKEKI